MSINTVSVESWTRLPSTAVHWPDYVQVTEPESEKIGGPLKALEKSSITLMKSTG